MITLPPFILSDLLLIFAETRIPRTSLVCECGGLADVFPYVASSVTVIATCGIMALVVVYAFKFTVRIYD